MRVFISYSSADTSIADRLVKFIESKGINCWIAHRDILPGTDYGSEIDKGFNNSDAVIYILSKSSIASKQVEQEVYLGNELQSHGLRLFPVFIEDVDLTGAFKYVLKSKQAVFWDKKNNDGLVTLSQAIINSCSEKEAMGEIGSYPRSNEFSKLLHSGIQKFFDVNVGKYCDTNINKDLIPKVVDYDKWLDELSALTLSDSMKKLWKSSEMSCLYIGKSGYGKTMGLFSIMDEIINDYSDIPVFFISMTECVGGSEHPILNYIFSKYIRKYNLNITFQDLINLFSNATVTDGHPGIILLLDDISNCPEDMIEHLQEEIDWMRSNRNVQMLITSRTVQHKFLLGNIAVQRFDFQKLDKSQIKGYLTSQGIQIKAKHIPLEILTNPLILTLFARTNDFVVKARGDKACYARHSISTEADVLWNYQEMFAMNFYREKVSDAEQLKHAFLFRFALPYIAFNMLKGKRTTIGLKQFCSYLTKSTGLLQLDAFTDTFEEYFSFEDDISFDKAEGKYIFENIMINQAGFLKRTSIGQYEFSKPELMHFFAAAYVYRSLLMHNNCNSMPYEMSEFIFTHEMCRYLGELCGENKNAKETMITWSIGKYRNHMDELGRRGVSNLLQILKISRNNDLSGLDFSYLDLRRSTFSQVVCGYEDNKGLITCFDGCAIDRWTFRTYGFSKDNAGIIIDEDRIIYTNGSQILEFELGTNENRVLVDYFDDFIQSIAYDPIQNMLLVAYLNAGIHEYDVLTGEIKASVPIDEGIRIGRAQYHNDSSIIYTTRNRTMVIYDREKEVTRKIIPCNTSVFTVMNDNYVIAPSRDRDIYLININSGHIERSFDAESTPCGYITQSMQSKDHKYVFASSKEGVFIIWNYEEDEPLKYAELHEDINSFIVYDDNTAFCLLEKKGLAKVNIGTLEITYIGAPFYNTWTGMAICKDMIYAISTEGSIFSYNCISEEFRSLIKKEECSTIPFIYVWNASFRNLNSQSTVDERVKQSLEHQHCLF